MQISIGGLGESVFVARAGVDGRIGHVVVDGDVDALDVDAAAEHVGADADSGDEVFEVGVAFDTVICVSVVQRSVVVGWQAYRSS